MRCPESIQHVAGRRSAVPIRIRMRSTRLLVRTSFGPFAGRGRADTLPVWLSATDRTADSRTLWNKHDLSEVLPPDCHFGFACCRVGCPFKHPALQRVTRDAASEKRICVWFQKGHCKNGSQCMFQHVQQERDANVLVVRNLPKSGDPLLLENEILAYFKSFGYVSHIQARVLTYRCLP